MNQTNKESTELEALASHYSDYHKDVYGYRPKLCTVEQWRLDYFRDLIEELDRRMDGRKETFAGREGLRAEGWCIDETEPLYIQMAKWLQEERDRVALTKD